MTRPLTAPFLWLAVACGTPNADSAADEPGASDPVDTSVPGDTAADVCDDPVGEGFGEGQISMDWTLEDLDGRSVSLYDYCGRVIYIENTAAW